MSDTTIEPRFPSILVERSDSGATVVCQHPDDPLDLTFMPSFLNEIPEEEADLQISDTRLELTLETPGFKVNINRDQRKKQ